MTVHVCWQVRGYQELGGASLSCPNISNQLGSIPAPPAAASAVRMRASMSARTCTGRAHVLKPLSRVASGWRIAGRSVTWAFACMQSGLCLCVCVSGNVPDSLYGVAYCRAHELFVHDLLIGLGVNRSRTIPAERL